MAIVVVNKIFGPKAGISKNMFESSVRTAIQNVLDEAAGVAKENFSQAMSTWSANHDRTVHIEKSGGNGDYSVLIYVMDKEFYWLDNGTSVRKVRMAKSFRPKTSYRQIPSGRGSPPYEPVGRGTFPGISARKFTDEIADRTQEVFNMVGFQLDFARGIIGFG